MKLYTDEELIEEVCSVIEELGGVVDSIDRANHLFKITIDPDLEEQAAVIVEDIINDYYIQRKLLFKRNPLARSLALREELYGNSGYKE